MTPASRLVPHDSTDRARCGLVSMFGMGIDALHMRCTYSGRRGEYVVFILYCRGGETMKYGVQ
jgi:hypothetical protein